MYKDPFKDVCDYCKNCKRMTNAIKKKELGTLEMEELGELREKCSNCKNYNGGIYKADAILSALVVQKEVDKWKQKRNVGKKPVRKKQYETAIKNLKKEGKTIREIATILGISPATVQNIINDL